MLVRGLRFLQVSVVQRILSVLAAVINNSFVLDTDPSPQEDVSELSLIQFLAAETTALPFLSDKDFLTPPSSSANDPLIDKSYSCPSSRIASMP